MATKMSKQEAAHECISEDALVHLKSYKYSSVDKSFISRYILKHYWNGFVELLPLWLAPNMVTLLGFFAIVANVCLLQIFDPKLTGEGPRWLYYSYAAGVWFYSTMDNVDGKQARRTGTSSGLGELFDHGIDSLNCTLASLLEASAMGLGLTATGIFTALIPTLPMFFSTWETYHTHTLYLGYFNGPTEGLLLATILMLVSAYYGPGIWRAPLASLFGLEKTLGSWSMVDVWIPLLLFSFFAAHLPDCMRNVIKARRAKNLSLSPVFMEWTPMVIFVSSLLLWLGSPESHILSHNYVTLLCLTLSFVFGRMTTKIILAHLTRQPFPKFTIMLAPIMGGALLTNMRFLGFEPVEPQTERVYLWGTFIFSAVVYFRWAVLVVNAICGYLGINCLTIPKEKWEAAKKAKSS
ncbi:Choline/ethanolaminephosphotransferase-like protein [Elsinoe fawcettii]|nr:Choline/ethanolaminephosphotransferase-like protein [Elsinoe fawcettii]